MARILALSGSVRTGSFNTRLLDAACRAVEEAGGELTRVGLREFELPLYDGDLEKDEGVPEPAQRLKDAFVAHQGLLLACPEYNGSITPLLKNAIDWVSRPVGEEPRLVAFRGKVCGLVAASPGALGGLRGLRHVREILSGIGVHVIPEQVAVGKAPEVLSGDGSTDEGTAKRLEGLAESLVRTTSRLHPE